MKINDSKPTTLADVKSILQNREKESELGYEQKQALDYADKFSKGTKKESEKAVEKLMKNEKITAEVANTIVNIAPKLPERVKVIAAKDKIELTDEEAEEIAKMF
ncbi:RNA polymerase Rpb4 family protein [Candidatus Micrarchaeota archaeon]|nr:RNA polymerase Rpb4 family protein [Candidatus Micrarchaeota archaeon]